MAMLNTLYPPTTAAPPTRQLTSSILDSQRNAFFRYIIGVEKNGKHILSNVETQGQRPGDMNGWAVIRDIMDKYLRTSNGVIEECMDVTGPEYFEAEAEAYRRNEQRTDSGIGFANGERPNTCNTASSTTAKSKAASANKPLPKSPPQQDSYSHTPLKKKSTTLERIARELRNLRNRNDVQEMPSARNEPYYDSQQQDVLKPKSSARSRSAIRKMRSTSSIRDRTASKSVHSRSGSEESRRDFDFDFDAKRRRMILEAQREKENRKPVTNTAGKPAVRAGRSSDLEA